MNSKVLVVDDSGLARRRIRAILEARRIRGDGGGGRHGRAGAVISSPSRTRLLDLVMKGMYGLDVLTKLREMDPSARVIVVSADVQTSSHDMVTRAGAAGFLIKPIDDEQVLALVRATLEPAP